MKRLRHNIRLLAVLMAALFIGLAAYFSYSVYFYGGRWFASANNPRLQDQKKRVTAGDLTDRTGMLLARTSDGARTYPPTLSIRQAVAHVVGDSNGIVANGAETFMAEYLLGFKSSVFERVQQLFTADPARGDDVRLTIDADLCEYAAKQLRGYRGGAVVLLNYVTGEVLCSTSYPDFDPREINTTMASAEDNGAFVNRVTQGLYPPGSTFKIITTAAALENMPETLERRFNCTGTMLVKGTTITEAAQQIHGTVTMKQAFAKSCNTAFGALSLELGYAKLSQTASSFAFGDNFLFRDLVVYNAQYPTTNQSQDDLAWSGVGQGRVLVTPLHMALITGAIANDGVMVEPRMMLSATTSKGATRTLQPTRSYKRVTTSATAQMIKEYMIECVVSGTGSRAQISGVTVAGKTGSAETSDDKTIPTHAWFVGFIDDAKHPLAVAVVVERGGSGSAVATPIAQKVLAKALEKGY